MAENGFLYEVVVFLAAAIVFVFLSRRLRANPILGYLAAGLLIGPHGLRLIASSETIQDLGALGVAFLLFSIGLDLTFKRLSVMRGQMFVLGSAQFLVTAVVIAGTAFLLGIGVDGAAVIGGALALSSTAMVLQLLSERGEIAGRMGRTCVAILLLQDLAAVPLLATVPLLGHSAAADWRDIAVAVATAAAAVVAIVGIGRLLLRPLLHAVAAIPGPEAFVAVTLLCVLGTGWAATQVGLSLSLGAFLAGLLLAETEFRHQVETDIRPFRGLLLGLFFMTIGMSLDLRAALDAWPVVALLVAALTVAKAFILLLLCRATGLPWALGVRVGLLLSQGGEFAFILIGGATAAGLLPDGVGQISLVIVGLSMALTPVLDVFGRFLAERLERLAPIGLAALEQENLDLESHVVIAGFGRVGQIVAKLLDARRIPYVVVDHDPAHVREGRAAGLAIFFGDASRPELLWGVGVHRAAAAAITLNDAEAARRIVSLLRNKLPALDILARARDRAHARELMRAGATAVVPETLEASLQLGGRVLQAMGLSDEDIARVIAEFRAGDYAAAKPVLPSEEAAEEEEGIGASVGSSSAREEAPTRSPGEENAPNRRPR